MSVASFLILEYDDDEGEWMQVVTDNIESRHEVLLIPRQRQTIGSLIHFINLLGYHAEVHACTVWGTHMDPAVWRVDYDPDSPDANAYRISVQ